MSEFEQLGAALREQLHALVADVQPSAELLRGVEELGDEPGRPRRRARVPWPRGRRLIALPLPIAAIAAVLAVLVGGSAAPPSLAVTVRSDGSVFVTINKITGVGPANAQLHSQGIRNVVVVAMSPACRVHFGMSYLATTARPAPTIGLTRHRPPHGVRVVIAALRIGPNKIEMAFGRTRGAIPACVTSHGIGPGLPGWRPPAAG